MIIFVSISDRNMRKRIDVNLNGEFVSPNPSERFKKMSTNLDSAGFLDPEIKSDRENENQIDLEQIQIFKMKTRGLMNLDFDEKSVVRSVKKLYTLISVDLMFDHYEEVMENVGLRG